MSIKSFWTKPRFRNQTKQSSANFLQLTAKSEQQLAEASKIRNQQTYTANSSKEAAKKNKFSEIIKRCFIFLIIILLVFASFLPLVVEQAAINNLETIFLPTTQQDIGSLEKEFYALNTKTSQWLKIMEDNPRAILPLNFFEDLERRNQLAAKLAMERAEVAEQVAKEEKEKEGLREIVSYLRESTVVNGASETYLTAITDNLKQEEAFYTDWLEQTKDAQGVILTLDKANLSFNPQQEKIIENLRKEAAARKREITEQLDTVKDLQQKMQIAQNGLSSAFKAYDIYYNIQKGEFLDGAGNAVDIGSKLAEIVYDEKQLKEVSKRLELGQGTLSAIKSISEGAYLDGALDAVKAINGFIKDYQSKEIKDTKNTLGLFLATDFHTPQLKKVQDNLVKNLAEKNNSLQKIDRVKKTFEQSEKVLKRIQTAWRVIKVFHGHLSNYQNLLNSDSTRTTTTANLIAGMSAVGDAIDRVVGYFPPIMAETVGQFFKFYADALKAGEGIDTKMRAMLKARGDGIGIDLIGGLQHSTAGRYFAENHTGLVEIAKEFEKSGLRVFHIENTNIYYFVPDTNQIPIKLDDSLYKQLATVCSNFTALQTILATSTGETLYLLTNEDLAGIISSLKNKTNKFQINDGWFSDSTYELDGTAITRRVNDKLIDIADALIHIKAAVGEQLTKSNLEKLLSSWVSFTDDIAFQEKLAGCVLVENDKQKHNLFIAFMENRTAYEITILRAKLMDNKCLQHAELKIVGDSKGELNTTVNLTTELNAPLKQLKNIKLVWYNDTTKLGEGFSFALPLEKEGSHKIRVEFYSSSTGSQKLLDSPIHTVTVGKEKALQSSVKVKINGAALLKLGQTEYYSASVDGTINQKPVYNYSLRYAWSHGEGTSSSISFEAKEPGLTALKCEVFATINKKEQKIGEAIHNITIPTRLLVTAPKEVNATDIFDVKAEIPKELAGKVKSVYWYGGILLSDKPSGQEGSEIKMQYSNGYLDKDQKTNQPIVSKKKIGIVLYDENRRELDQGFAEIIVKPVYFQGSASEIWEGNTGLSLSLKRKPIKNGPRLQYSAEGDPSYVSTASVWGEALAYWTDRYSFKNTEDIAKHLKEAASKEQELVPISIADFKGYALEKKLSFSAGYGGWMTGYVGCSTYAGSSIGYLIKGQVIIGVHYFGSGGGSHDNEDRPWLEPLTQSVSAEAKAIVTGLRIGPDPKFAKTPYTGPKLDGSDFAAKLAVNLTATNKVYRPGQQPITITANVTGGKPPYNYQWTGQHGGKGGKIDFVSSKPGLEKLTVTVTSSDKQTASASIEIKVEKLEVKITGLEGQIVYGTKRKLNITPGGFRVYWQASQNLNFSPVESANGSTDIIFDRIGEVAIWAQVLDKNGATIGEAKQQVINVVPPKFQVVFDPPSGAKVGQEIKVTITTIPEIDSNLVNYVWSSPISSNRMEYSNNSNEIGFKLRETKPFELLAIAKIPTLGDELAEIKANYTATAYQVKAEVVGATYSGPTPTVWDPVKQTLVPVPKGTYITDQMVTVKAEVIGEPQPNGVRWDWAVNSGTTIGNNISQTPTISRHEPGTAEAIVVAKDNDGVFLGTAKTSFTVLESGEKAAPMTVKLLATKTKLNTNEVTDIKVEIKNGVAPFSYVWRGPLVEDRREVVKVRAGQKGKFSVTVTVTDLRGKTASQTIDIEVLGIDLSAKIKEAENLVQLGKLDEAILVMEQAVRQDPENSQAIQYEQKLKTERNKVMSQLNITQQLINEARFAEAQAALVIAQNLHPKYQPVVDMAQELSTSWNEYNNKIQTILNEVRKANEERDFQKAIDMINQIRSTMKLDRYAQEQLTNQENWSRKMLAEKENIRRILQAGENKLRQYDYAGALRDFDQGFVNFNNYWNNRDPETAKYIKLREEVFIKNRRVNELLSTVRPIAENPSLDTPVNVLQQALRDADELIQLQPNNVNAKRYRDSILNKLNRITKENSKLDQAKKLRAEGQKLENAGDLKGAIDKYQQSLAILPDANLAAHIKVLQDKLNKINNQGSDTGKKGETGTIDLSGTRWDWFDPKADASYNLSGNTIIIRAPNGNDLWPAFNFDAPRLTKQVTGDFNLQVRVNSQWRSDGYNGAGLAVNVGKTSVIRFERGLDGAIGGHHIVIFAFAEGREVGRSHIAFSANDFYLKLERRANNFTGWASANGRDWQKVGTITANFPANIAAGLTLIHQHSNSTFQASFSDFSLTKVTSTGKTDPSKPTDKPIDKPVVVGDRITAGYTSTGTSYAPNCKGDVFTGGSWCNSRNQSDWIERDLSGLYEIREIRIGQAGTDVTTKNSRIVIKLQLANGQWVVVDELKETNINLRELSFGGIGNSIPSYRKVLTPPIVTKTFRMELSGNGWFGAKDIALIGRAFNSTNIPVDKPIDKPTNKPTDPINKPDPPIKTGLQVTAIVENKSTDNVHIFIDGENFSPNNRLAPQEKRSISVKMLPNGAIKFFAGRNGKVITSKIWYGDPEHLDRYPKVIFTNDNTLLVTTGLK